MFASEDDLLSYDYMSVLCSKLMLPAEEGKKGVKIIDFSEVPSDILPLIVSLIARVIFLFNSGQLLNTDTLLQFSVTRHICISQPIRKKALMMPA